MIMQRRTTWGALMMAGVLAGSGCITHRTLAVPLTTNEIAKLRDDLDGRTVDVDYLAGPVRKLETGEAAFVSQRTSGVARLDPPGQALLLRLDNGSGAVIPLRQTRLITDDQNLRWLGIGALAGLGTGLALVAVTFRGEEGQCPECLAFSRVVIPIGATLLGTFIGGLIGGHKSVQWRLTTAPTP